MMAASWRGCKLSIVLGTDKKGGIAPAFAVRVP
jgi:hypothetical protein